MGRGVSMGVVARGQGQNLLYFFRSTYKFAFFKIFLTMKIILDDHFSRQPKMSNNSTNSTPYMHFAPVLLENLPLTPHFAPPFGNLPIDTAKYVQILTSNLILRPLFDLCPGAAALPCPSSLRQWVGKYEPL